MANTTWNPSDKTAGVTLTGSNLIATASGASNAVRATDRQVTGKFYWEVTLTTASASYGVGYANQSATLSSVYSIPTNAIIVYTSGSIWLNNVNTGITLGSLAAGGVVLCLAVDIANRLFWARIGAAGNWNANAAYSPATGYGGIDISLIGGIAVPIYPTACFGVAAACTANFGDTAFSGAVPSGFTSGFTAGATIATNALATQAAVEHWLTTDVPAQVTQVALEQWATVTGTGLQAVVTQVALEHWASVASVSTSVNGPMITMIG